MISGFVMAKVGLDRPDMRRLVTIPGADMAVAIAIVATVRDFTGPLTGQAGQLLRG